MIYGFSLLICVAFFVFLGIKYTEKYEMGLIVFKSIETSFDAVGGEVKMFYLHCILKKNGSKSTNNFKLEVSKEVYDYYRLNDNFPIKN